jgi:hypothetical protein
VLDVNGTGIGGASTNLAIPINTWVHIAWVNAESTSYYYVNGASYGSTSGMKSAPGVERQHCSIADPMDITNPVGTGGYDDIKIYGRALSAVEVVADMNLPPVFDL